MILRSINQYLAQTGMPPTLFGRLVAHDPRLVDDLRNGREPREDLAGKITRFIARNADYRHAQEMAAKRRWRERNGA